MDILKDKSNQQLAETALAEIAKSKNEIQSAESDIRKAKNRLSFLIVLANEMINRKED